MGILKEAKSIKIPSNAIIVHADDGWFDHLLAGGCNFFEQIGARAAKQGIEMFLVHSDSLLSLTFLYRNFTQIMMGPKRHKGKRVFHAYPSYIWGFWYLDPSGYFWNSSLIDKKFDPNKIDIEVARFFYNGVSGHMLRENVSKRPQSDRGAAPLAAAQAAIFLQDIEKYKKKVHYLDTREIIQTTALSCADLVYVKLHPLLDQEAVRLIRLQCDGFDNVQIVDSSVHDIIDCSGVIITQNSAVGFEAIMHKKPVITCARCDYHHASLVSQTKDALIENISTAEEHFTDFPYEKYFYWFMGMHMLEPEKDEFAEKAMRRLGIE